jgi:predicted transport protein
LQDRIGTESTPPTTVDENGSPVIFEYKRSVNENVINQGLFYLDWLLDHRAEFELLVMKKLGTQVAEQIDWSAPRLICVASDFTRYDEHAIAQINRSIELVRYRALGDDVTKTTRQLYYAFRRIKNFACVEIHPQSRKLLVYLKTDPSSITLEPGFTRDVTKIGHFGTGNLEVVIGGRSGSWSCD